MSPRGDVQVDRSRTGRARGRLAVLALIVLGLAGALALGMHSGISFEEIARHREALLSWREQHELLAVVAFVGAYTVTVALSVPGAGWFTILGGFLFGVVSGSAWSLLGATLGACGAFLAARYLLGERLRARAAARVRRMDAGFRRNALNYLLVLRLLPIFPFWLVNIVPAFLNVPFRTFVVGTFLGIAPGSLVYAGVGHGLGAVIAAGRAPDLDVVFEPEVLAPLVALAALSLAPVLWRRWRGGRSEEPESGS